LAFVYRAKTRIFRAKDGGAQPRVLQAEISGQVHTLALKHIHRRLRPQEGHESTRGCGVLRLGGDARGIGICFCSSGGNRRSHRRRRRAQFGDLLHADLGSPDAMAAHRTALHDDSLGLDRIGNTKLLDTVTKCWPLEPWLVADRLRRQEAALSLSGVLTSGLGAPAFHADGHLRIISSVLRRPPQRVLANSSTISVFVMTRSAARIGDRP